MAAAPESATQETVDAFILFNESENIVETIDRELSARGVSTYFWRRDIPVGSSWQDIEREQLKTARAVVVFLGERSWGPNHLRLAIEAQRLQKYIVPVLIGTPPPQAFEEASAMFRDLRYLDLKQPNEASLDGLARAIRAPLRPSDRTGQLSGIISTLIDGSEEQRLDVLRRIKSGESIDKAALADRLRQDIETRFGPAQEGSGAIAVRDPKKISSIRSWMLSCLIEADAVSGPSRDLLLKHVGVSFEPNRNVRFWVLAGLFGSRVGYLAEAARICTLDPEPEVSSLAQAIGKSGDTALIDRFRKMLFSEDFHTAWAVLRVLRVFPIPDLARDVCAQLERLASGTSLSYDALYALADRAMAANAAPILRETRGVKGLVALVVKVAQDSDRNALRHFAALLDAFDPNAIEAAFSELEQENAAARGIVRALRRFMAQIRRVDVAPELFVAGYASDTVNVKNDHLNIREDVQTLAAVMLAKEVTPPIAIGLFGDWGSGKSFFMQSMEAAAEGIAANAKDNPESKFCSGIVSVRFNAWHYSDTNLWASLVDQILEKLAAHVSPKLSPDAQLATLIKDLESAKSAVSQIESEKNVADKEIQDRVNELKDLQSKREQKEIELRDLRLADLQTVFKDKPNLKATLDNSLQQMGVPTAITSASELAQAVSEVNSLRGRATALLIGLFTAQDRKWVIGLVAALIVIPFAAAWIYQHFTNVFVAVGTIVAEAAVIVGAAVKFLRQAAGYVKTHLDEVEKAKRSVDSLLAEKRKTPSLEETKLQEEIASLKAKEEQASSRMQAATAKVIDLEQRIAVLKESRSLTRFLAERTQSDDYRKHLGLISTIRRDFEKLRESLVSSSKEPGANKVERIILYIDDLDRCPAEKVVEVLQAVHLLLAYDLFVVVVGVDPRWLSHSLTATYGALKGAGNRSQKDDGEGSTDLELWRTTPQNYLEKIFQIPISLRPMTVDGYSKLVQGLFSPTIVRKSPSPDGNKPDPAPPLDNTISKPGPSPGSVEPPISDFVRAAGQATAATAQKTQDAGADQDFTIHDESLEIKPVEMMFAERLYRLLPTPRATKRFSNIYRILKAPVPPEELMSFEGTEQMPGAFQVPMLLLAILIGMPGEAAVLFPRLYQRILDGFDPIDELTRYDMQLLKDSTQGGILRAAVSEISLDSNFPRTRETYTYWLPRVSRFSFEIGRAINPAFVSRKPG